MIKGIDIILYEKSETGTDEFNRPTYEETAVTVSNVLVAPTTDEEVLNELNLTGRKAVYTLGIPKGDTHTWEDSTVEFFGHKWRTIGIPVEGIEAMIPLSWHKKVKVERYEQ